MTVRLLGRHMIYPMLAAVAVAHRRRLRAGSCAGAFVRSCADPRAHGARAAAQRRDRAARRFQVGIGNGARRARRSGRDPGVAPRRAARLGDRTARTRSGRCIRRSGSGSREWRRICSCSVTISSPCGRAPAAAACPGRRSPMRAGRSSDAAGALSRLLQPGDVLLIKGRGPEKLDRVRLILEGRRRSMRYSLLQFSHGRMRRLRDAGARLGPAPRDHVTDAPAVAAR